MLLGAVAVIAAAVAVVLFLNRSYHGYSARVILTDSGGLQSGSNVTVGGVTVGQIASLGLDAHDQAVAVVHLENSAAPLGTGATALVQIDGFFGERELSLTRGDYKAHPQPSGMTIPTSASGVSVRLDDVVDALNMDAQGALRTFLDEQGSALVGRGHDLASVLSALPPSLSGLQQLMSQLSANQRALGDLVDRSDRVVAAVATQRNSLGQMINSANGAFGALASRRAQLGQTVQTAPATLRQARSTLATLQGAAIPLAPAADGLRATAPSLTAALRQIPAFANAAVPTLNTIAAVAPALQRLGDEATPVVRSLAPMTSELTDYTTQALSPVTSMLGAAGGAANLFGEMEGWARSTSGYDASSHIFRFGATVGSSTFAQLLNDLKGSGLPPLRRASGSAATTAGTPISTHAPSTAAAQPGAPAAGAGATASATASGTPPAPPAPSSAAGSAAPTGPLQSLLDYLLKR
jgi:virulence factor Mce-like protein